MRLHSTLLVTLWLVSVAANCEAQPPAIGCWNDCSLAAFDGAPGGVAVGSNGDVFVEYGPQQFVRFDQVGNCGAVWHTAPLPPATFPTWTGVGVATNGDYLAADRRTGDIYRWSRSGDSLYVFGGAGSQPGKFTFLMGLAVGPSGSIYVGDQFTNRIERFDGSGVFLSQWSTLEQVVSLAVDDSGYVFAGSATQHVFKYTSTGSLVASWGGPGSGPGLFSSVGFMAVDHLGHLLVNDIGNEVVQEFTTSGAYVDTWSAPRAGGLAFDSLNNLYVSYYGADPRVCKYGPGPVPARASSWGSVKVRYR